MSNILIVLLLFVLIISIPKTGVKENYSGLKYYKTSDNKYLHIGGNTMELSSVYTFFYDGFKTSGIKNVFYSIDYKNNVVSPTTLNFNVRVATCTGPCTGIQKFGTSYYIKLTYADGYISGNDGTNTWYITKKSNNNFYSLTITTDKTKALIFTEH